MKIWSNVTFLPEATRLLEEGIAGHRLVYARDANRAYAVSAAADPELKDADIAFGQPHPDDCAALGGLRWIELTTAGYTRYDKPAIFESLVSRKAILTNTSEIYADPCAEHILAMMLALGRELLPSYREQLNDRAWSNPERRVRSVLLTGQTLVMLGFGSIGRRLARVLAPFDMRLFAVRRRAHSETSVRIVPEGELTRVLGLADHVVNILPETEATRNYVNARRVGCFKPGARFYGVGRGATTDQAAILEGLHSGRIGAAYLDVTVPEPLPPDHPLWSAPNCYITPHTAGGRSDYERALVSHFIANFAAFVAGGPMRDRVL